MPCCHYCHLKASRVSPSSIRPALCESCGALLPRVPVSSGGQENRPLLGCAGASSLKGGGSSFRQQGQVRGAVPEQGTHREHHCFSHGQALGTRVTSGLVSETPGGIPLVGRAGGSSPRGSCPRLAQGTNSVHVEGATEPVCLNCFLAAVENDGHYCVLQKPEPLVSLCSDLSAYNGNNPVLDLGCRASSPDGGPSCPPLHICLVPTSCWWDVSHLVSGLGYCLAPQAQSMWPPRLLLLYQGSGLTKAGLLSSAGWVVEVGWGRNGGRNPQGISVRRAEPWDGRAAQDGG